MANGDGRMYRGVRFMVAPIPAQHSGWRWWIPGPDGGRLFRSLADLRMAVRAYCARSAP